MRNLVSWLSIGALAILAALPATAVEITYELVIAEGNESTVFEGKVALTEEPRTGNEASQDKHQTTLVGRVDQVFEFAGNTIFDLNFTNVLDPVSTVTFGITDGGAPTTFALSVFGLAIVPSLTDMAELEASIFATCADADQAGGSAGGAGCTYSPVAGQSSVARYGINGLFVSALDINPGETIDGVSGAGSLFMATTMIDCGMAPYAPNCTTMNHSIAFTGPGGGDSMTFTSRLEIDRSTQGVPAPGTLALLSTALLGLFGLQRTR